MFYYYAFIIFMLNLKILHCSEERIKVSGLFMKCFIQCIDKEQNDVEVTSSNIICMCKAKGKIKYWNYQLSRPVPQSPRDFKDFMIIGISLTHQPTVPCSVVKDCATMKSQNSSLGNGIYTIDPGDGRGTFNAFCDMTTARGGWTVIQVRKDGSENFNRTFDEYANGFGSLKKNFWLGNEKINRLTQQAPVLRFQLKNSKGVRRQASYRNFFIHGRSQLYKFQIGVYTGNAGHSFSKASPFSTFDKGPHKDCALKLGGGWWYAQCFAPGVNVNGKYSTSTRKHALRWRSWRKGDSYLRATEVKIRRLNYHTDCATLKTGDPSLKSGMYKIYPGIENDEMMVYCDMETDGGGWTVIQRRMDGSLNFRKRFRVYERGFGDREREFWLGARHIHHIVRDVPSVLRFDLRDINNRSTFAEYDPITIGSPSGFYELHMGEYKGTAGDGFRAFDGELLTTFDNKFKSYCPSEGFEGGWWYKKCLGSINDKYITKNGSRIKWEPADGPSFSLTFTEMKVRRTRNGRECNILKKQGKKSGMYSVNPDWRGQFDVFCDMDQDDAGWMNWHCKQFLNTILKYAPDGNISYLELLIIGTVDRTHLVNFNEIVIQRRLDGSENFIRGWKDYKTGFGNKSAEFWLGNDLLHRLTSNEDYLLRFDMEDVDGKRRFGIYRSFKVDSERNNYKLSVGSYCGDAGDSLSELRSHFFTTVDKDNSESMGSECPEDFSVTGGWWYKSCHSSNPNGEYNASHSGRGITWSTFQDTDNAIKLMEMKIRVFGG